MDNLKRIGLVSTALQSTYARQSRVSVYQFVNRLLLLFQSPIIFLFYKKENNNKRYRLMFHTHQDILFQDRFNEDVLYHLHENENNQGQKIYYYNPQSKKHPYLPEEKTEYPSEPYIIEKTNYFFILIKIKKTPNNEGHLYFKAVDACPNSIQINKENIPSILNQHGETPYKEYIKLKCLWDIMIRSEFSNRIGITNKISESLHACQNRFTFPKTLPKIDQYNAPLIQSDQDYIDNCIKEINPVFNQIYNAIYECPVLSYEGRKPANILFFLKYYDNADLRYRYGGSKQDVYYNYSLKIIIPETQKEHLVSAIEAIKKVKPLKGGSWIYKPEKIFGENIGSEEIKKDYFNSNLADEFWKYLEKKESIDIINELEKPFSKHERSLTDPVIESGFTQYKRGISLSGGQERIKKEIWQKGFKSPEVRRIVIFHYVLSIMTPASDIKTLGTLAIPIREDQTSYCATLHACLNDDTNDNEEVQWHENFHLFTDISRTVTNQIRIELKRTYLKTLEDNIATEFRRAIALLATKKIESVNLTDVLITINHKNSLVCRVFPYPLVEIKQDLESGLGFHNNCKYFKKYLYVNILRNEFYSVEFDSADYKKQDQEIVRAIQNILAVLEVEALSGLSTISQEKL